MKKTVLLLSLSALFLVGCESQTTGVYSEKTTNTRPDEVITMETMFSNDDLIYTEQEIVADKKSILNEKHGYQSSDEYLVKLSDRGVDLSVIEKGTIGFNFDSYNLSAEAMALIKEHSKLLKSAQKLKVILEGHTDSTGDRSYNLKLSERRALAVKDYAISLGVQADQIEVVAYGEEMLLNKEKNEQERKLNRRAEFVYK